MVQDFCETFSVGDVVVWNPAFEEVGAQMLFGHPRKMLGKGPFKISEVTSVAPAGIEAAGHTQHVTIQTLDGKPLYFIPAKRLWRGSGAMFTKKK
ncbi:MAG: hypothetical protein Q7R54_00150 [bacterium]|nr:hypothetical protein [bacterium]